MEDLPLYIDSFLEQTCHELGKTKPTICREVKDYLQQYNWPGNIRELRNTIRRASLFVDRENVILENALPSHIKDNVEYFPDATHTREIRKREYKDTI